MLEILTLLLLFFVLFCGFILLPILLMVKAVQLLFEPAINEIAGALEEKREHDWRQANAAEREKMVWYASRVAGESSAELLVLVQWSPVPAWQPHPQSESRVVWLAGDF